MKFTPNAGNNLQVLLTFEKVIKKYSRKYVIRKLFYDENNAKCSGLCEEESTADEKT